MEETNDYEKVKKSFQERYRKKRDTSYTMGLVVSLQIKPYEIVLQVIEKALAVYDEAKLTEEQKFVFMLTGVVVKA